MKDASSLEDRGPIARRGGPKPYGWAIALALAALASAVPAAAVVPDERPDIVVVYIDDFPQHTIELWSDPERTPALARFPAEGTWFSGATGSTPICCPGRAGTLTGQWSHHHGVISNDMGPFDPSDTLATHLQGAGYHTIYGGKYLNGFASYAPSSELVEPYANGWHDFDVIWESQGRFYDYRTWSRDGTGERGRAPEDHSTQVMTDAVARRIREAPMDQPVFAFLSLVHGHRKNLPLPRFVGHAACAGVSPWAGPSFDEEDVSDKPAYVQAAPRLEAPGYDLRTRCEEIMSVDWAAQQLLDAVASRGSDAGTLFVFTNDNGYLIGEHRLEGKVYPYSTPVPFYLLWPERWADAPRVITEPVSNVDLAPTLCEIAGCELPEADGTSLVPLLDGAGPPPRTFIYEENLLVRGRKPGWYGLRTTSAFSADTRWVYTEYSTGEVELYDLGADPWQLENLADSPAHAGTRDTLRTLLHEQVVEPDGVTFAEGLPGDDD